MIGVVADPMRHDVVREFFELFKTAWELYRPARAYDVILCAGVAPPLGAAARLIVVYGRERLALDDAAAGDPPRAACVRTDEGVRVPLAGRALTFDPGSPLLIDADTGRSAARVVTLGHATVVRVGYDLFDEIRAALTIGQPPEHAAIPTVDVHIAILRDLIVRYAPPLVEVPPVPAGYPFIACLTHDIDHALVRHHRFDHTMLGFLYRALAGSVVNLVRGRWPARLALTNWRAALRLPFVHLGWAKDFWADFDRRYLDLEAGLPSTFFAIPFPDRPGRRHDGKAPRNRAARYGAADISAQLRRVSAAGCEVGLHGIDAWRDSAKGREELEEVARVSGHHELGVRMHWLYTDAETAATLEKAGFLYDSTSGYNGTIGFRAGTSQVFKPLEAIRLLELPLHVMDTALFYPSHLGLSPSDATRRVRALVDHAERFGGVVTVNWHERSIAPERLWEEPYRAVVDDLRDRGAWFATASGAVGWFRKRRSVAFESVRRERGGLRVTVAAQRNDAVPALRLRVHTARQHAIDVEVNGRTDIVIALPAPEGRS